MIWKQARTSPGAVGTYIVFDQRFAQMELVRVDQQGAVMIRVRLTQLGRGA